MNIKYLTFGSEREYQGILSEIIHTFNRHDTLEKPEVNSSIELKVNYHLQKIELEKDWIKHLVEKTVELIEKKLESIVQCDISTDLYIFMLPELWMYVPTELGKATITQNAIDYHRPFSNEVVRKMLENSGYHRITAKYRKLLLCPGTVWWKDIYEASTGFQEVYFQSAPVFFQGECIAFWDKQTLSDKDGAGPVNEMGSKVKKWVDYRKKIIGNDVPKDAKELMEGIENYLNDHEPIRSTISSTCNRGIVKNNAFIISLGINTISFGIEICLDCCYNITEKMKVNKPDIQLIVSCGLGFIPDMMSYTNSYTLWCDREYGTFVSNQTLNSFVEVNLDTQKRIGQYDFVLIK